MTSPLPPRATPLHPSKKAILIGASSGIGAALARRLAAEGTVVALAGRRKERLDELCGAINAASGEVRALAYTHDVQDVGAVPGLLKQMVADLGGLDLFIYSAGITKPVGLRHFDAATDLETLQVNTLGAVAWLDPVAQLFQSARSGTIVGISSVAGERGRVGNPAYCTSKAALTTFLESLRNRLTRLGVHVLTVKPGYVDTEITHGQKGLFWLISAEKAAELICRAIRKRRQTVYVPSRWGLVMFVLRSIPSVIFRRLSF